MEEERMFMFQRYGSREYIKARTWQEALKIYKKKHSQDISRVANWEWMEDMQRFIVNKGKKLKV